MCIRDRSWSLQAIHDPAPAQLLWACEPSSPLGQAQPGLAAWVDGLQPGQQLVLDCAYSPLRLQGQPSLDAARLDKVWQLWTPNTVSYTHLDVYKRQALGGCSRLVGVDRYSNWPASVRTLPQLGGGIDPNVEAVVAQKPDLVLLAKSSRVVERLESLGLKVMVLEPKNHADMRRVLDKIGQVLGTADSQRVWREIDARVSATAQSLPASVKNMRVY